VVDKPVFICQNCGKEFVPQRRTQKYCSRTCVNNGKKKGVVKKCVVCGKEFEILPCDLKKRKGVYCSHKCSNSVKRNSVTKTCSYCGKEFVVTKARDNAKYCSRTCVNLAQSKNQRGKNNSRYKGKVDVTCEYCGTKFKVIPVRADTARFCSRVCKRKSEQNKVEQHCKNCGKLFSVFPTEIKKGGGKYCSKDCYNEARGGEKVERVCKNCGCTFYVYQSIVDRGNGHFCCLKCRSDYYSGKQSPNWKGGASFEPYCQLFNYNFKKRVRDFFGNTCLLCGATKEENKGRNLCVHHVEENKQTCCDDSPRLFVTLCSSCHTKVHNAKNRSAFESFFINIINTQYSGRCYLTKEERIQLKEMGKV